MGRRKNPPRKKTLIDTIREFKTKSQVLQDILQIVLRNKNRVDHNDYRNFGLIYALERFDANPSCQQRIDNEWIVLSPSYKRYTTFHGIESYLVIKLKFKHNPRFKDGKRAIMYHGTSFQGMLGIMSRRFKTSMGRDSCMFGAGIYCAPDRIKSEGFGTCLFRLHTRISKVYEANKASRGLASSLKNTDYNCIHGMAGKTITFGDRTLNYDEYVFFDERDICFESLEIRVKLL